MLLSYFYEDERAWTLNQERSDNLWVHRKRTAIWRAAFKELAEPDVAAGNRLTLVEITVRQECNRPPLPDPVSCVGAYKAALDGLVEAGLLPNDTGAVVRRVIFMPARRTGRDRLTLSLRQLGTLTDD